MSTIPAGADGIPGGIAISRASRTTALARSPPPLASICAA